MEYLTKDLDYIHMGTQQAFSFLWVKKKKNAYIW